MLIRQRECHSYYRDVYTITSLYMPGLLPSDWLRRLSTQQKNEHV